MDKKNNAYLYLMVVGIVLVIIGFFIQMPGGALTTHEILDGDSTDSYVFDSKYSAIDEYVGGDAYNYIIGATLVSAKITGVLIMKAIFIASGLISLGLGLTLKTLLKKEETVVLNENVEKDSDTKNDIEENTENIEPSMQ